MDTSSHKRAASVPVYADREDFRALKGALRNIAAAEDASGCRNFKGHGCVSADRPARSGRRVQGGRVASVSRRPRSVSLVAQAARQARGRGRVAPPAPSKRRQPIRPRELQANKQASSALQFVVRLLHPLAQGPHQTMIPASFCSSAIRGATSGHKLGILRRPLEATCLSISVDDFPKPACVHPAGSTAGNSAVNAEERRAQMLAAAEGRQQESLQKGISAKGAAKLHEYQVRQARLAACQTAWMGQ